MSTPTRLAAIAAAKTIVIKIGTNVLSRADDTIDREQIAHFVDQFLAIQKTGRKVVVVSSGAVGAGMERLGLSKRPTDLPHLQAAAATGQSFLVSMYEAALQKYGKHAAQLLLTAEDFKHRTRYLNIRNTIHTLFEYGVIPIINENDTVSISEIKFGDNDALAAMVASLVEEPILIILSNVEGLYDGHPADPGSRLIQLVEHLNNDVLAKALDLKSSRGTGGMVSKLRAVQKVNAVGESVIIAQGKKPNILERIIDGEELGTLFLPKGQHVPAWKRWIGYTVNPKGAILLDEGACKAVKEGGKSLLAIGIKDVRGDFIDGELLSIMDLAGHEIARGLTNYTSSDVRLIQGLKKDQIAERLGSLPYEEVIHRDNLVVLAH
jgi:glutamate 5-kinase